VRYLARRLRDAGFEVIFTNFLLAQEVVNTAIQEDVAVVGVSTSTGWSCRCLRIYCKAYDKPGRRISS
jgi:methylmalonyl-CoA mutase cobalamin-binding domain/chain